MPRKPKKQDDLDFANEIVEVFRKTTQDERRKIALDWCLGDYQIADGYSARGLLPIAVIVAVLIDIDHPLLVSPGRGVMYGAVGCAVQVLTVEMNNTPVDIPYPQKTVNSVPVDSLCT